MSTKLPNGGYEPNAIARQQHKDRKMQNPQNIHLRQR